MAFEKDVKARYIFIFTFTGSSNQNYMKYMLDLYALLEFECSPELKEALLNNWLINLPRRNWEIH
ncbi:hypothetical protein B0H14DRAFT_3527284 [Mycena olivaceomarginata]|nr:hypothetical protein B0H14DRAFT_3527284 [Mycena olivaceomarginata]